MAVAFTEFNNNEEWELDPSYGTLVFNSFEWGVRPDGKVFTERKRLPSHVCTQDEFGFERGGEARYSDLNSENHVLFFKVHPMAKEFQKLYRKKFICLDKESLEVFGDFSSTFARQLNV